MTNDLMAVIPSSPVGFFIGSRLQSRSVIEAELIETVTKRRMEQIKDEVKCLFPDATARYAIDPEGRGIISVTLEGYFLSQEYVETERSCDRPQRWLEYLKVLRDRMRLVVVAPASKARAIRLKMLEFNQWWLFYYLVFSYDEKGNIRRVGCP